VERLLVCEQSEQMSGSGDTKRQRREAKGEPTDKNQDRGQRLLKLGGGLRAVLGREYCRANALVPCLMAANCATVTTTFVVTVEVLDGTEFSVVMNESQNRVRHLKQEIMDKDGTAAFSQQLFLLPNPNCGENGTQMPLKDTDIIESSCSVALCVQISEGLCFLFSDSL
jgi:hypothetical protein